MALYYYGICDSDHTPFSRYYAGRDPMILVADPEILHRIMLKDFHKFPNRPVCVMDCFRQYNQLIYNT